MNRFLTSTIPVLMFASASVLTTATAETVRTPLGMQSAETVSNPPVKIDPFDIRSLLTTIKYKPEKKSSVFQKKTLKKAFETSESGKVYTGAFQSYYEYYEFKPDGGEYLTYDVTVTIDGTEATISNLFNLEDGYPWDNSVQQDIKGVYDADANTITIPTPRKFDQATIAGYIYNYSPAVVVCGHVTPDGMLQSEDELVLLISEDGNRISTNQDFGTMTYTTDGTAIGFKCIYKGGVMLDTEVASEIVCLTKSINLERCYSGDKNERYFNIFNLSQAASSVTLSSDNPVFEIITPEVEVASLSQESITIAYHPEDIGSDTGIIRMESGGIVHEVEVSGECVEPIDYSGLVVEGDIDFKTDAIYPFTLCEYDGRQAARSTCVAIDQCKSYLTLSFEVPEGQLGRLSWKGVSSSAVSYASLPTIVADGRVIGSYEGMTNADISGNRTFSPGQHQVTFSYSVEWATYFSTTDYMTVYDFALQCETVEENKAVLLTDVLEMPNSLLESEEITLEGNIVLSNHGTKLLKVTEITDSEHFTLTKPDKSVKTFEELSVPVLFKASEAGFYEETVKIATTGGDFDVTCRALVRNMPDFQQIVKEGEFTFTTDPQYPWLVADGKAYNSTSKVIDTELTNCTLTAEFTVPEGYIGKLSWKGKLSTQGMVENTWTDYLTIQISSSFGTKVTLIPGEYDLDTSLYPYFDTPDMTDLLCGPGECSVTFNYVQIGDEAYSADDLVELYDLGLELLNHEGSSAVIDSDEVTFPDIYAGKHAEIKVSLLNTGLDLLEIYDLEGDGAFNGYFSDYTPVYNQSTDVWLTFDPENAGEYDGNVTIYTSAGDFVVKCHGMAIATDGMLLIEDFEDDGAGWSIYDRDGDGDGWNLAYNVYGGFPQGHVHSGEECIVSFSWDYLNGTFTPDNWTFSPEFEIPDSGAWLTWWSAGDDNNRPGDIYSVYVGVGEPEIGLDFNMDDYKCFYTETVISDEWTQHCVDISEFKGNEVHVAFRHYDCSGCYMVKIDDVIVYDHNPGLSVDLSPAESITVVAKSYYSIDGKQISSSAEGFVLIKETLSDGSTRTRKLVK